MSQQPDHVRVTFLLLIDGYIEHPTGEMLIERESWEHLKQYHIAIGGHFISTNASGGSEGNAQQILASRGARFKKVSDHPELTAFVTDDE